MKIRQALSSCVLLMTGIAALAANPSVFFGQTVSGGDAIVCCGGAPGVAELAGAPTNPWFRRQPAAREDRP